VQTARLYFSVVGNLRRPQRRVGLRPLGVELKRNLKDYWWRCMTQVRDDIVGFDGSILMNRAVWKASGHEDTFSDPMVECMLTKKRFRADQIEPQSGTVYSYLGVAWTQKLVPGPNGDMMPYAHIGQPQEEVLPYAVLVSKGRNQASADKIARQYYSQRGYQIFELRYAGSQEMEGTVGFNPETGAYLDRKRPST